MDSSRARVGRLLGHLAPTPPAQRAPVAAASPPRRWQHPEPSASPEVRIAAVQISGYDKGDLPRAGFDPVAALLPYIRRAGQDGAELVVFPEYVLGHIPVPGPSTQRIAAAARQARVSVIVGCWEVLDAERLRNTALLFDRSGETVGKYHKTHAAVDQCDGAQTPWVSPPAGKTRDWLLENDPEWVLIFASFVHQRPISVD